MSNLSIFKQATTVAPTRVREVSELAKSLADASTGGNRIVMNKGVFRRMINGKEAGKVRDGFLNVIVINALPKVSRQFYAKAYDPDGEATLPDCWSNLGAAPESTASNAQSASCVTCPQNIDGSGPNGKGRACRFLRRVALMLDGDPSGQVYQFNIPSKSLFGKGVGNTHPFESYKNFLPANGESIDRVVTEMRFDENETGDVLKFTAVRHLTDDEIDLVETAQKSVEAKRFVQLTAAAMDGVKKLPAAIPAKPAPVVQQAAPKGPQFAAEDEDEPVAAEPIKRASKKSEPEAPAPKKNLADVVSAWAEE
jgi:hypothetical protein